MADPVKFLNNELTLSTANTINNGTLIRLINWDSANSALITQKYSNGSIKSSFTLGHHTTDYGSLFVIKDPTDTLTANNLTNNGAYAGVGIRAVSVGYY